MVRYTAALVAFVACITAVLAGGGTMTLRGKVDSVSKDDKDGSLWVKITTTTGNAEEDALQVRKVTKVEKATGKTRSAGKAADIQPGQHMEAVCGKIVQPSRPQLVRTVQSVLILGAGK